MTWSETKRRWRIMREIEELFLADPDAQLPWTEEYAELFGDRDGLVAALRYRWQLTRDAQLDSYVARAGAGRAARPGGAADPDLLRILDTAAARRSGWGSCRLPSTRILPAPRGRSSRGRSRTGCSAASSTARPARAT